MIGETDDTLRARARHRWSLRETLLETVLAAIEVLVRDRVQVTLAFEVVA